MSKAPVDIFEAAQGVGTGAPLKTAKTKGGDSSVPVRSKLLRTLPVDFFDRHEALRKAGLTTLDFSSFIVEAIREKLEQNEQK
ncbi:TPA: chaperonin [Salmonella enterica subsp. enterica serovar Virchow]